jgi:hypothetical protein
MTYLKEKLESRSYSIDSLLQLLQENSKLESVDNNIKLETI